MTEIINFLTFITSSVSNKVGSFTNEQISLLYRTFVDEAIDPIDTN
jgi:hypothetical protein